jgi:integrative and conjugative element protein (TIGR02256 family)
MMKLKSGNLIIKISGDILIQLKKYIQDDDKKHEAGGLVVGYYTDPNIFSITDISTPHKEDKSSRFRFLRSKKQAQLFISKLYKESNRKKIYLGEWHTHPENHPTPSGLDKCSILKQYKCNRLNSDVIFMIIVGRKSIYIAKVDKKGFQYIDNIKLNESI